MILDGYNRMAYLGEGDDQIRVIYRPCLRAHANERRRFMFEARFLGGDRQREVWDAWLWQHVVDWTYEHRGPNGIDRMRMEREDCLDKLRRLIYGLDKDASGETWRNVELQWRQNLYDGVRLDLIDPLLARRSCDDCRKYWYLSNGLVKTIQATGEKELRPANAYTACKTEFGCLKGTPEHQKSLNTANAWAWRHFKTCEATGRFPDDLIVAHNAEIIRRAIKSVETQKRGSVPAGTDHVRQSW